MNVVEMMSPNGVDAAMVREQLAREYDEAGEQLVGLGIPSDFPLAFRLFVLQYRTYEETQIRQP